MGLGTILTTKYRTSVLYDFSAVTKAKFYILEEDSNSSLSSANKYCLPYTFKLAEKKPLPMQINPNQLSFSHGNDKVETDYRKAIPLKQNASIPIIQPPKYDGHGSLNLSLQYDIYDEYMVQTRNGTMDFNQLSLLDETVTSLKTLSNYAGRHGFYVLFLWGEIEYFGILTSVDVTYSAFSRYGTPLKASGSAVIEKQALAYDSKTGCEKSPLSSGAIILADKTKIKADRTAERILTQASAVVADAAVLGAGIALYATSNR